MENLERIPCNIANIVGNKLGNKEGNNSFKENIYIKSMRRGARKWRYKKR